MDVFYHFKKSQSGAECNLSVNFFELNITLEHQNAHQCGLTEQEPRFGDVVENAV